MKYQWAALLLLFPMLAYGSLSGVDDLDPSITPQQSEVFDNAIMSYYQEPSVQKINTVLDMLNTTEVLRKKTAWAPIVGFMTVVFADNKDHVFDWISRNDYNNYAQKLIVTSLLHAKLKESALVFAQAQQWSPKEIEEIRNNVDDVDLKHLKITIPSHIDTLWGAFFGSGDPVYLNEIIDVLFRNYVPYSEKVPAPVMDYDVVGENKKLAESTLRQYAQQEGVRKIIKERLTHEVMPSAREKLKDILAKAGS